MIRIENVSKSFKLNNKQIVALDNVSFPLANRGSYVIYGKSGAGKSTLLKILYGLTNADSGKIYCDNKIIPNLSIFNTVYISQDYGLLDKLSVYDNFKLLLNNHDKNYHDIDKYLDKLGILHLKYKKVRFLSGGERAKIAFARALAAKPDIILADEPTASLDPKSRQFVYDIIKEYSKEHLVIVISHDSLMKSECEHILFLENGIIKNENDIKDSPFLFKKPQIKPNYLILMKLYFKRKISFFLSYILISVFIGLTCYCLSILNADYNVIAARTIRETNTDLIYSNVDSSDLKYDYFLVDKIINFPIDADNVESTIADRWIIDESLDDDTIAVSDVTYFSLIKYNRLFYDGFEKKHFVNVSINNNDYPLFVCYYKTDYKEYLNNPEKTNEYLNTHCIYNYINFATYKKTIMDDYRVVYECSINDIPNTIIRYSERFDYIRYNDDYVTNYELNDNEIIIKMNYLPPVEDYGVYVGKEMELKFSENGRSYYKKFVIKDVMSTKFAASNARAYIKKDTMDEIVSNLIGDDIESLQEYGIAMSRVYKINDDTTFEEILNFVSSSGYKEISFFESSNLQLAIRKIETSKITIRLILYFSILMAIGSFFLIIVTSSKMFKKEYRNLRELNYKLKDILFINQSVILINAISILLSYFILNMYINSINVKYYDIFGYNINYIDLTNFILSIMIVLNIFVSLFYICLSSIKYKKYNLSN